MSDSDSDVDYIPTITAAQYDYQRAVLDTDASMVSEFMVHPSIHALALRQGADYVIDLHKQFEADCTMLSNLEAELRANTNKLKQIRQDSRLSNNNQSEAISQIVKALLQHKDTALEFEQHFSSQVKSIQESVEDCYKVHEKLCTDLQQVKENLSRPSSTLTTDLLSSLGDWLSLEPLSEDTDMYGLLLSLDVTNLGG